MFLGQKVGQVRFKWAPHEPSTEQKLALIVLKNTYETLRTEFGLNQSDFDQIIKNREIYTDERIQQAMDYTRHQAAAGAIKKRVAGYFRRRSMNSTLSGHWTKSSPSEPSKQNKLINAPSKCRTAARLRTSTPTTPLARLKRLKLVGTLTTSCWKKKRYP
jgi:hypothetical protein